MKEDISERKGWVSVTIGKISKIVRNSIDSSMTIIRNDERVNSRFSSKCREFPTGEYKFRYWAAIPMTRFF